MISTTSAELYRRALEKIPGGVSSPVRAFKHVGREPIYIARAEGAHLHDVENQSYIDFCLSFGPHILGHCPKEVVAAIQAQAAKGMSYGACHPQELELAELILKGYPFLDKVRLVNSGTEAVMTAVRLARGFTGRDKVITFEGCYHGHSDGFLAKAGSGVAELSEASSKGVPPSIVSDTIVANLSDLDSLRHLFKEKGASIAAVLLELIPANHGLTVPDAKVIDEIFALARQHGALVIADEVITGFRVGLSGACGHFDVQPDLVTLGKIIGGGLPLAAVAGKRAVMDMLAPIGPVYQAGTLSGNPLATAAGVATLKRLYADPPYTELEARTRSFVGELIEGLRRRGDKVGARTFASVFWLRFSAEGDGTPPPVSPESAKKYAEFFSRALKAGVYFPPSPYEVSFLSTAHTDNLLAETVERLCQP